MDKAANLPKVALDNPHDRNLSPSKLPQRAQWAMMALFVMSMGISTVFAFTEQWRRATFVLGMALLWLSIVRWTCDSKTLGVLSVRSRNFDTAFTGVMGAAIVFLAASVDPLGS